MQKELKEARQIVKQRTVVAYGQLQDFFCKAGVGENRTWRSFQSADRVTLFHIANVFFQSFYREEGNGISDLFRFCIDCHAVTMGEISQKAFNALDPEKKEISLAFVHVMNGEFLHNPKIIPKLTTRGVDFGGSTCYFCDRVNGKARMIRRFQAVESPIPCFGTPIDYCTEMDWCSYQVWDRENWSSRKKLLPEVKCVIPQDRAVLDEKSMSRTPFDYWTWLIRVAILKQRGRYPFWIPRLEN